MGEEGIFWSLENNQEIPSIYESNFIDIDQTKLEVQFSFIKGTVKYNLSKLKDSIRNTVLSPVILKYLKLITRKLKWKEVPNYLKKLKKFSQNNNGKSIVFTEKFSETIASLMKDTFQKSPLILYCWTPAVPTKYFLEYSMLHPLKQWESSGYKEWFTYSEFLSKFKALLNKALPDTISKKILFQLCPEERIVMIVWSFLKCQNSVYFGTTHVLLKTEALRQLEVQLEEKPWIVRSLPNDPTMLVNYIKSKFNDMNRVRDIKIKHEESSNSSDDEMEINTQLLSKCSSRKVLLNQNINEGSSRNGGIFSSHNGGTNWDLSLNCSLISKSSALLSTFQNELDKKIMNYRQKESKKPKAEIDTKYTRALKQYLKK